jgi:hypothetical protein
VSGWSERQKKQQNRKTQLFPRRNKPVPVKMSHAIGIETVLYEYIHNGKTAEAIADCYYPPSYIICKIKKK